MFNKKILILFLLLLVSILFIGSTTMKIYDLYEYQHDLSYLNQIEKSKYFSLVYTETIGNCNDYGCYNGTVKYYKSIDIFEKEYDSFIVFITLDLKPQNDLSNDLTDTYITLESLKIYTDINKDLNQNLSLINYPFMSSKHKSSLNFNLSLNNLLGQKVLSKSLNEVGYIHQSRSTEGIYQGNYQFIDHVTNTSVMSYYVYEYPKSETTFKNTIKITSKFKKISPFFLFIKSTDTLTSETLHEIEFPNT